MNGKKRPIAHIKGETGVQVLKRHFPAEWVVREYVPDYGIDLSIELFSPIEGGYVTKGEHVFFQVKGTNSIEKVPYKIHPRMNVEMEYRGLEGERQVIIRSATPQIKRDNMQTFV